MQVDFLNMPVIAFNKMMNDAVKDMKGFKYKEKEGGFHAVHKMIEERICNILPEGLNFGTWYVSIEGKHEMNLFAYDIKDMPDGRFKYRAQGTVVEVVFNQVNSVYYAGTEKKYPIHAPNQTTTMQEWMDKVELVLLHAKADRFEELIVSHRESIAVLNEDLTQFKTRINEIKEKQNLVSNKHLV